MELRIFGLTVLLSFATWLLYRMADVLQAKK
jgi:hypothetical protein